MYLKFTLKLIFDMF